MPESIENTAPSQPESPPVVGQTAVPPSNACQSPQVIPAPKSEVFACYGHAWRRLWKNFAMLLLIGLITFALSIAGNFLPCGLGYAFGILVGWPLSYAMQFIYLKAVRGEPIEVEHLFLPFKNYGNVLLSNLLSIIIILAGFAMLIVPGIIFACKLSFVPYLVMEGKEDAADAIAQSWIMTRGYTWKIFLLGLLAFLIFLAGVICLCLGAIPASFWIGLASASMYYAVSSKAK